MLSDEVKDNIKCLEENEFQMAYNGILPKIEAQEELIKEMLSHIEHCKNKGCIIASRTIIQKAKELMESKQ